MNISKETLEFINKGYDEVVKTNKLLEYTSFVQGAQYVIENLMKKERI